MVAISKACRHKQPLRRLLSIKALFRVVANTAWGCETSAGLRSFKAQWRGGAGPCWLPAHSRRKQGFEPPRERQRFQTLPLWVLHAWTSKKDNVKE
jgi:hypothetical protein